MIKYISNIAIPLVILIIIIYGMKERIKVYDNFLDGAKEGMEIVLNMLPTLIGIFMAVGALKSSGILEKIVELVTPVCNTFNIPSQIIPLSIVRPISGSSSTAVAVDIMKSYGVDSTIGIIASVIMGSTETTIYTIAVYTGSIGIKKTRCILLSALIADIVGMITSIIICKIL